MCLLSPKQAENRIRIRFDNSSMDTADRPGLPVWILASRLALLVQYHLFVRLRKDIQSVGEELGYARSLGIFLNHFLVSGCFRNFQDDVSLKSQDY